MNVLLIMVDEWRHDTFSMMKHPVALTPHIDALAARGTRFSEAYCASPLCGPSRASFFTGQYVNRHGGWSNGANHHVRPDQESLVHRLHAAGYRLGHAGKNHTFQDATFERFFRRHRAVPSCRSCAARPIPTARRSSRKWEIRPRRPPPGIGRRMTTTTGSAVPGTAGSGLLSTLCGAGRWRQS